MTINMIILNLVIFKYSSRTSQLLLQMQFNTTPWGKSHENRIPNPSGRVAKSYQLHMCTHQNPPPPTSQSTTLSLSFCFFNVFHVVKPKVPAASLKGVSPKSLEWLLFFVSTWNKPSKGEENGLKPNKYFCLGN